MQDLSKLMPSITQFGSARLEPIFIERQLRLPQKQKFVRDSLKQAMASLYRDRGSNELNWQWGKVHKAVFNEVGLGKAKLIAWIWRRSIATPGGDFTVNVGTFNPTNFQQTTGASYRQIINMSDLNDSLYIQTLGQSESPSNSHYSDQMPMWRDGEYIQMRSQTLRCLRDKKAWLGIVTSLTAGSTAGVRPRNFAFFLEVRWVE